MPLLQTLGVEFRYPSPHTPQQHGKVERKHQHIIEKALTLLAQAELPLKFWWEACVFAVFLINRLPTATLGHISLFQKLFHSKPNYSFLKVFGCACYPYL